MNWLKRRVRRWLDSEGDCLATNSVKTVVRGNEGLETEPLRLNIFKANGGMVVEARTYDRQKDRSQNQLHIVSHDQDLGHSLAKIITMESLRG